MIDEDIMINELNLDEIDFDEDIPVDKDLFSEEESEGGIYVEEDDVFDSNADDLVLVEIPKLVFVDDEGIQHIETSEERPAVPSTLKDKNTVGPKPFSCSICSKNYSRESAHKKHENICK